MSKIGVFNDFDSAMPPNLERRIKKVSRGFWKHVWHWPFLSTDQPRLPEFHVGFLKGRNGAFIVTIVVVVVSWGWTISWGREGIVIHWVDLWTKSTLLKNIPLSRQWQNIYNIYGPSLLYFKISHFLANEKIFIIFMDLKISHFSSWKNIHPLLILLHLFDDRA